MKKYIRERYLIRMLICFLAPSLIFQASAQQTSPRVIGAAGNVYPAGTSTISYSIGEPAIKTFSSGTFTLTEGYQQPWDLYSVYGLLTYSNNASTPMKTATIRLTNMGGSIIGSATSNQTGNFYLYQIPYGNGIFSGETTTPPGSINATDALLTLKHFVHMVNLTGLKKTAADVDLSGYINSVDALLIAKYFTGVIPAFPSGPWLFSKDTIPFSASPLLHNLKAICNGDVDGSYIPGIKTESGISIFNEGELLYSGEKELSIPVRIKEAASLGAISLVLNDTSGQISFLGAQMAENSGNMIVNCTNNQIRIAWYTENGLNLNPNDILLYLKVKVNPMFAHVDLVPLIAGNECEFAGPDADVLRNTGILIPKIKTGFVTGTFALGEGIPNPTKDEIRFLLSLPEQAQAFSRITNIIGETIRNTDYGELPAGQHPLDFRAETLCAGTYLYSLTLTSKKEKTVFTRRFVVVK